MNKYIKYIVIFCLCFVPIFVIAQSTDSISNITTGITSTGTADTSINYTYVTLPKSVNLVQTNPNAITTSTQDNSINYSYETIPKKFVYEKDTQIGLLERELCKKTATSTIEGVSYWYGAKFHGRKMANGEKFDMNNPTMIAHRTLKLGTKLKITNTKNGNLIYAVVSYRGPYSYKWIVDKNGKKIKKYTAEIDVSYAGAKLLGIDKSGMGNVKIEVY